MLTVPDLRDLVVEAIRERARGLGLEDQGNPYRVLEEICKAEE